MAGLNETDEWADEVYQIEMSDPVVGGAPNEGTGAGMSNIPHLQLAKRTRWLKTRVDQLLGQVVAATTAVAGIVRLSTATNSTSTTTAATPSAVKAANDNAELRALKSTTITPTGLATGGGSLSANRTIDVPAASNVETVAGEIANKAVTPAGAAALLAAKFGTSGRLGEIAFEITDWNDAATNGWFVGNSALNAPPETVLWFIGHVTARASTWITQTAWAFTVDAAEDTRTWRRECNNGMWGDWYRLRLSEAEQAALWTPVGRKVVGGGLATGGGALSLDRTITVSDATQAEAEAGTSTTVAMSPLRVAQAIAARLLGRTISTSGLATGGGDLSANRTITVAIATQAEAEAGTSNTKAMTPLRVAQHLALNGFGSGQVWQDMRASRTGGTVYQNTTGKSIMVALDSPVPFDVSADGVTWIELANNANYPASWLIPNGHYYRLRSASTIYTWAELR
jgi:hypothetical protein